MDVHSSIRFNIRGISKVFGIFTLHEWSGIMELKVNCEHVAYIDSYSPEPKRALLCLFDGSINEDVEIVLQPVGKNEKSNSCQIVFHGILFKKEELASILLGKEDEIIETEISLDALKEIKQYKLTNALSLVDGVVGKFIVINNDEVVSQSIYRTGCWGEDELPTFKRCIRRGDTVFDIGSNIGHHSVFFSKTVGRKGNVYCFEPQDFLFKTLCANLLLNGCTNTHPFRLGIGDKQEFIRMLPLSYDVPGNYAALGISKDHQHEQGELVETLTVDIFMERYAIKRIDFIKIDVQTFELFVLRGAMKTIMHYQPIIYLEVSPYWMKNINGYDYLEIYKLLNECGYTMLNPDTFSRHESPLIFAESLDDYKTTEWEVLAWPNARSNEL